MPGHGLWIHGGSTENHSRRANQPRLSDERRPAEGLGGQVVRVGKVEAATIQDWCPEPGNLISWQPSRASLTKATQAPISPVPPSYMQTQHLRNYRAYLDNGL